MKSLAVNLAWFWLSAPRLSISFGSAFFCIGFPFLIARSLYTFCLYIHRYKPRRNESMTVSTIKAIVWKVHFISSTLITCPSLNQKQFAKRLIFWSEAKPLKWNVIPQVCCQNISEITEEIILKSKMASRNRGPRCDSSESQMQRVKIAHFNNRCTQLDLGP